MKKKRMARTYTSLDGDSSFLFFGISSKIVQAMGGKNPQIISCLSPICSASCQ